MTTAKKTKSKAAASERGRALQVAEIPAPRPKDTTQWHEQAAFHLTLDRAPDANDATIWRTHVYHEESGEEQTQSGILQHDLIHWIRERAGAPHPAQEPVTAVADAPQLAAATPSATPIARPRLDVDELAIEAIETENQAGGAALKRLRAQVRFARLEVPATLIPETSLGTIQVLACPHEPGQTIVLGVSQRELAANEPSYTATLEFDLPPLGEYQTIANVVLEDEGLVGAGLGPVLTVVP
jgi:hypothetical protein